MTTFTGKHPMENKRYINKNLPRLKIYLKNEREGIPEIYFLLLSIYHIINGKT